MTQSYQIEGMTCGGCVAGIKSNLLKRSEVLSAEVSLPDNAVLQLQQHVSLSELQQTIGSKYKISERTTPGDSIIEAEETKSWLSTYKPLLLVFAFITGISFITSFKNGSLHGGLWMNNFMAGFFLLFSFFKFLDLKGFAQSYSNYDLLAQKLKGYGFVYPFIELALGIAYLTGFAPFVTNYVTILVMSFSSLGVIQSLLSRKKIKCACLGAVFNLPMSSVTIIEDLLMVAMALAMLLMVWN